MKFVYYPAVFMLSGLLVLVSLLLPVTVSNRSEIAQVKFGLPLPFVVQDQSHYDPPFPWQLDFNFNPWEPSPTRILWPQFLLDVAIVFGAITVVMRVTKAVVLSTLPPRRR